MEHKKAFDFLIKKSLSMNFKELAKHIKKVGPLKIKTSNMKFVDHLVKIIVGQQLSVKSAAAIWERTEKILINELQKAHPDYGIITEEAGIINKDNNMNRKNISLFSKKHFPSIKLSPDLKTWTKLGDDPLLKCNIHGLTVFKHNDET